MEAQPPALAVLQALLTHETAGHWIEHVLDNLIQTTCKIVPHLRSVIVDHGPGLAAVQRCALDAILENKKPPNARGLIVTTPDYVDLKAVAQHFASLAATAGPPPPLHWLINRVPASWTTPSFLASEVWFNTSIKMNDDPKIREGNQNSTLPTVAIDDRIKGPISTLRKNIFGT
jgi:hypothetical protein